MFVPANCAPGRSGGFCRSGTTQGIRSQRRFPTLRRTSADAPEQSGSGRTLRNDARGCRQRNPRRGYAKEYRRGVRATEVSHDFGNFVTLVLRSNPCENVVIAGLCQRKFIAHLPKAGMRYPPCSPKSGRNARCRSKVVRVREPKSKQGFGSSLFTPRTSISPSS